jgi:ferritin-like metal-binding protein YciE
MAGIVDEGEDIIDDTDDGTAQRDVGLIFAGQKAEHYEIATYGGLITLAQTLGYNQAADLMKQTLEEEKNADVKLTSIAENDINYQAAREQAED